MAESPLSDTVTSSKIDVNEVERAYRLASVHSFEVFYRGLTVPSASGPLLFDSILADFQREFFRLVGPSLHAVRDGELPPLRRFWLERTKKTSKDNDVAVCLLWLIAFSSRPLLCQVCAANSEQAAIIEDRARAILHHNPWLDKRVEIVQRCIRSRKMPHTVKVQIESTGTAGAAQGPTPDVLVLNELVHVDRWGVMKAHMNNAAGVPRGVVIVATNAGILGSEAEVWRKAALSNPARWTVCLWSKPAPWLSPEDLADAKKLDPIGMEYARLWEGRWVSGIGDAVDEDSIERCFCLPGPTQRPEDGWRYLGGLDLGISHDHAGVIVVGVHQQRQKVKVVRLRGFVPSVPNDRGVLEVDSEAVELECQLVSELYGIEWFGYDPAAGGSFMSQRLRKKGLRMREACFASPTFQTEMAGAFVSLTKDGRLECYNDPEGRLRRDFGKFSITHKPPNRYKLEAASDHHGHADVGMALVLTLPQALGILNDYAERLLPSDALVYDEEDLTEEEVDMMPDELREIYEM